MKRSIASLTLMALVVAAVASMMIQSARADIVVFTAQMLAGNEVPPVSNAEINANGSAVVTIDTALNTARFDFTVGNLTTPVILAHVHEAPAGVNGPIRIDSLISPAAPLPPVSGFVTFSRSNLTAPADVVQRILANPAGFYFNVHTALNPGGVVRGQLVRQQEVSGVGAPTLSEWGAIIMALLFIAAGIFFLAGRGRLLAANGAAGEAGLSAHENGVDWKLLAGVTLVVEAIIAVGLLALAAGAVDVFGALTAGLVLSFIIHMLIATARRR
jgi:hypothetical protein